MAASVLCSAVDHGRSEGGGRQRRGDRATHLPTHLPYHASYPTRRRDPQNRNSVRSIPANNENRSTVILSPEEPSVRKSGAR